jgi:hypothetical protein
MVRFLDWHKPGYSLSAEHAGPRVGTRDTGRAGSGDGRPVPVFGERAVRSLRPHVTG